jgi:hypothetical protein
MTHRAAVLIETLLNAYAFNLTGAYDEALPMNDHPAVLLEASSVSPEEFRGPGPGSGPDFNSGTS